MNYDSDNIDEKISQQRELDKKYINKLHELTKKGPRKLRRPDTNLEFWMGQKITIDDLNKMDQVPFHLFSPGILYLGKKYKLMNKDGVVCRPDIYVEYNVNGVKIDSINICDPDVHIYGITINSSEEEIEQKMLANGFSPLEKINLFSEDYYKTIIWICGSIHMTISKDGINIWQYHIGDENILY